MQQRGLMAINLLQKSFASGDACRTLALVGVVDWIILTLHLLRVMYWPSAIFPPATTAKSVFMSLQPRDTKRIHLLKWQRVGSSFPAVRVFDATR
jgi:hypothetical protein